jgi:hypothetical protein
MDLWQSIVLDISGQKEDPMVVSHLMFVLHVPSDVLLEVLLPTCITTTVGIGHTDTTISSIWCVAEAAKRIPTLT